MYPTNEVTMSLTNKQWLGLPLNLVWGYIAIAIFMTGDGFDWHSCRITLKHWVSRLQKPPLPLRSMAWRQRFPPGFPA